MIFQANNWWFWSLLCDLWLPYKPTTTTTTTATTTATATNDTATTATATASHSQAMRRKSYNKTYHQATLLRYRNRKTRAHNLFENEDKSDIIFLVGDEVYKERIPVHSWILSSRNHVFRVMFHETWADQRKNVYSIRNDPKGFQNLLKWLYRQECGLQSLDSALTTLHVAIQYLCPELAKLCVAYISQHLNDSNVLRVMQHIHSYCPRTPPPTAPSAPSLEALEGRKQEVLRSMVQDVSDDADLGDPTECCVDLYNECLEILDRATSSVLASEGLEELDHDALKVVLRRQTLGVKEEVEVVEAVVRWATAQCKRNSLPLTPQNRRRMLGDLLFSLRLLKLSPAQVSVASKFLERDELEYVRAEVSGKGKRLSPPVTLAPYVQLMATARGPVVLPAAISEPPTSAGKKKCGNKKRYTKKELLLDIVSFLAIIFD